MTYHILSFFVKCLSYLPFSILYILSDFLFYIIYYVAHYRRRIVRKNLTESFPKLSKQEIKQIEKKFYHFFTDNMLESCKLATISSQEICKRMKFTNIEAVNAVLRQGKSIALFLGHYGNWEWCSSMPLSLEKGIIGAQIYHKLHNESMDRLFLHNRERMGAVCVEMQKTARYINKLAHEHKVSLIGFIADQSPKKQDAHYFLQFLHHTAPVLVGTEKIAKHYRFEAWFLAMKRVKRGYYEAQFVPMHETPYLLPDFELTIIYYRMLEKMIQENPEFYLWTHNRFKHALQSNESHEGKIIFLEKQ